MRTKGTREGKERVQERGRQQGGTRRDVLPVITRQEVNSLQSGYDLTHRCFEVQERLRQEFRYVSTYTYTTPSRVILGGGGSGLRNQEPKMGISKRRNSIGNRLTNRRSRMGSHNLRISTKGGYRCEDPLIHLRQRYRQD